MTSILLSAFIMGLAVCAPPGAVNAEAIRRGFMQGFRPALLVELGSLIGDAMWGIIALGGAAFIVQFLLLRLGLGIAGTILVEGLAWRALTDAFYGPQLLEAQSASGRGAFPTGMLLSLGNPFAMAFWLGVGSTTIAAQRSQPQWFDHLTFLGAFLGGAMLWGIAFAAMVTWGRQFVSVSFFRWVSLFCGSFMAYVGLQLGWDTLRLIPLFGDLAL